MATAPRPQPQATLEQHYQMLTSLSLSKINKKDRSVIPNILSPCSRLVDFNIAACCLQSVE